MGPEKKSELRLNTLKSVSRVIRRDNQQTPFEEQRIFNAILRAGESTGEFRDVEAAKLTTMVRRILNYRFSGQDVHIEDIQDMVEEALIMAGYVQTARSYIRYREKHRELRQDRKAAIEAISTVNEYLEKLDWRVNANANQGYSLGGLILNSAGKITANYWLSHVYTPEIGAAHRQGDYHIHDLDMLSGYCAGWSLRTLLEEGFNGVKGKIEANPPKHLSSALGQMVNFLGSLQNEWAGAQAFSSFDTYLAPFVRRDSLSEQEVEQAIQEFVYNLNVPSRWGTQTPFTNLTFDWVCPEDLAGKTPLIGGKSELFTYGDLQPEMDLINRAFIKVMLEGDRRGRVFTFPIPTYNITKNFDWNHPNTELLFEMTAKYGLPYFQNFLNSELSPSMIRSMCCRLQLDLRELLKRGNGLFGSAEQTGSIGVVTVNLPRLGYVYRGDFDGFLKRLDQLMDMAKDSLETKRKVISRLMENGLFPFSRHFLGSFQNHFSTIGINGMNECVRNFSDDRHDVTDSWGIGFAERVLRHMREKLVEFQEETSHLYNLEATPAEGTTYRLAKEDRKRFPDILQAGPPEAPYYTNSSQLPAGFTEDPFLALSLQDKLQSLYTGGTVLHLYMAERVSSAEVCKRIVKNALTKFRLPYITITPTFSTCPRHGYLQGEQEICPKCAEEGLEQICEIWTRVMGYHRPVSQFNKGKKSEYKERICFTEQAVQQRGEL
jgi:ribonucleoside-triphosphate reductase (formate)